MRTAKKLLAASYALIKEKGYRLVNLDSTIIAEEPKMKTLHSGYAAGCV